ncbi:MAG: bifunctional UDP-sugar hydrolase/5'-nucleotidase [Elusimicrobia bacterium]|nr:bifunctional UDP-sugar hydrolase/5'-nucleotidase [Elusimicrobiota bacterium]
MKNLKKLLFWCITIIFVGVLYFLYLGLTTTQITILNTNDVHGHILSSPDNFGGDIGGSAILSNFLKKQKKPYMLLDAGDIFQGTPEGDLGDGEIIIKIMNELGYDAMTIGNHEFDKGQTQLKKLIEMANFSVLGANIVDKKTGQTPKWMESYFIKEIKGIKIAVLGLTTSAMPYITIPEVSRGLQFKREVDVAKKYIPQLKKKADIIVLLTHIGLSEENDFEDDVFLAKNVEGIDMIIGGHTHTFLKNPIKVKNTIIVQAGGNGRCVGQTILKIRNKKIVNLKCKLVSLTKKKYGEDLEFKKIIDNLTKDISGKMETVIGTSEQFLSHSLTKNLLKNGELPLGNWQADVFRKITDSDVAFQNIGGIRADLPEGKITIRNIYELSPFRNTIFTLQLTGAQIRGILEKSVSGKAVTLQVSGLKYKYDMDKDEGERIIEVNIGDNPIDLKKYYKVATNSFLVKGGDSFSVFKKGKNTHDTGIIDTEAQIQFVKSHSPIKAQVEGRIENITK